MANNDRAAYDDMLTKRRRERLSSQRGGLEFMAQAEIAAGKLQVHPDWKPFLQILQGELEVAKQGLESEKMTFLDHRLDADAVSRSRLRACILQARINTLEEVIALPLGMQAGGAKAAEALDELDEASD